MQCDEGSPNPCTRRAQPYQCCHSLTRRAVVWQVINQGQCAFRVKTVEQNFCRNENNVTGLCNRQSCPLANSRYATIREVEGKCYLFMKTIERSFSPARMWEKIKLSSDYAVALQQLDEQLQYWPKYLVHKAKQRLTKITQYLVRMRKLKLKPKMKLVGITKKTEKREARREEKAEKAAKIENSIESALLERLKKGTYGDIYNFPVEEYNKALDEEERLADEMELEEEQDGNVEFVEDFSDLDEEDLEDCARRALPPCHARALIVHWQTIFLV
jgi:protein MAK16